MLHFNWEQKLAIVTACGLLLAVIVVVLVYKLAKTFDLCGKFRQAREKRNSEELGKAGYGFLEKPNHRLRYKLIDYKHLVHSVPSIKVTAIVDEKKKVSPRNGSPNTPSMRSPPSPDHYSSFKINESGFLQLRSSRESTRSTSSCSASSTSSSEQLSTQSRRHLFGYLRDTSSTFSSDCDAGASVLARPVLEISLQYDKAREKLIIFLYCARRIPPNVYGGASDSFVQIVVGEDTRGYWARRSGSPSALDTRTNPTSPAGSDCSANSEGGYRKLAEFKTRVIRKDTEPLFTEWFVLDGISEKDRKNVWIKFVLWNMDRFCHRYIVGTKQINTDRATTTDKEKFYVPLDSYTPNVGEMTLSLCYMPTAGRLVVRITRVTNLKPPIGLTSTNPYLKGVILRRGKVLEKRCTLARYNDPHPTFADEPLVYDVPAYELEKIVLLITVYHEQPNLVNDQLGPTWPNIERRRSETAISDQSATQETKMCVPFGRLAFGSMSSIDPATRRHWAEMASNPRKHVARTHKLRP